MHELHACVSSNQHNISGDEDAEIWPEYKYRPLLGSTRAIFRGKQVEADSSSYRRRAILISGIGGKAYDLLADLCSPASPSYKSYAELKAILKKRLPPKRLVISERYRFHTFAQAENTSVSEFAAQLQRLASTYKFGTHLPEASRDRFVYGLRSRAIQKRLLTEDVNFERALHLAQGQEASEYDVAQLNLQLPSADEGLQYPG